MQVSVKWGGNAVFVGQTGSGHDLVMDGPPDHGGENRGPRPMEMLLLGVGGCSSFDVMSILKKRRQAVSDCHCHIEAERADAVPAVFTRINLHFVVSGDNLSEKAVAQAVKLSAEKYCSASIMLQQGGVNITHSHEVVDS
ncbi:MAG: OsmC family protein [Porticoccaceae bacterium]|nr:OsmC family protein [Porticoccaceae bacterium]